MDANCNTGLFVNKIKCPTPKSQSIEAANKCNKRASVNEPLDGWLSELSGWHGCYVMYAFSRVGAV